nr:MAG: ORF1 [TTV-like mini virus]UGV34686.1 MAG: ORF1 [TTV-like mini virus]UGV39556.1 MAG: ORF1 [TTV-like mini virus]
MPWRRNYYYKRRRPWIRYWRPRKPLWRRRRRRRYRYRQPVRRKLKSLILREFQPPCIHKTKIKGSVPLLWGPIERFNHNYELYELSTAPPKIPSGGLFSIKNFSLEALYAEQKYCRNIWTKSNNNLPLVRYTGCKFKIYRSLHTDLIVSYSNSLPLTANLDMYQSMHPGIHTLLHHKIIIPRKKDNTYKKSYKTIRIKPPTPLLNKWYFQHDIAATPLVQIRTSAISLDEYYINFKSISTTISIWFLSTAIQNYNFKFNPTSGYWCRKHNDQPIYLWSTKNGQPITKDTLFINLTFLGNTTDFQEGDGLTWGADEATYLKNNSRQHWGNPFFNRYLMQDKPVYFTTVNVTTIYRIWQTAPHGTTPETKKIENSVTFTLTDLTDQLRYNPLNDKGSKNTAWLQSLKADTTKIEPPAETSIYRTSYLPLWVLLHGFEDFQKKNHTVQAIDTDYMIIIQSNFRNQQVIDTLPIIDLDFIQGRSPYENAVDTKDRERWHPCIQMQQQSLATITSSGPGSPKQPPLQAIEAKMDYTFYFKWGGNPPPMETITDPATQPEIHIPTNFLRTNSLQNPTTRPETLLYQFDERRGLITDKAIKRLQKDWPTKEYTFTDGSPLGAAIQKTQETSTEDSSEEEEETTDLLLKLRNQRRKHKLLKLKILEKMGILPK